MKLNTSDIYRDGEEMEIDLLALMWHLIYRFRSICVVAIIFAIVGGAFGAYKYVSTEEVDMSTATLSDMEETTVDDAYMQCEKLLNKERYIYESAYMNIDPYDHYLAKLQYGVDTGAENIKDDKSAMIANAIKGCIDTSNDALVLTTEVIADNTKAGSGNSAYIGSIVDVKIVAATEDDAEAYLSAIDAVVSESTETLQDKFGKFEVICLSKGVKQDADSNMANDQSAIRTSFDTDLSSLTTLIGALNPVQTYKLSEKINASQNSQDYEDSVALSSLVGDAVVAQGKSVKTIIKFLIVGLIAGAFLMVVYIALVDILSGVIYGVSDIGQKYGLTVLGDIYAEDKKNRIFDKIRYKNRESAEESVKITALNIANKGLGKALIVSTVVLNDEDKKTVKQICGSMQYEIADGLLKTADSLAKLNDAENVIVLEKKLSSKAMDVRGELVKCAESNVNVIGVVAI